MEKGVVKSVNILLVGERYSPNLGDGVIFNTVEAMICQEFPGANIFGIDLSGRVTYCDDTDWLMTGWQSFVSKNISANTARALLVKKQLNKILDSQEIDVIIFVGGQLFMDYFSWSILTIVKQAQNRNIPVIFNSCGFGNNSFSGQKRIQKALSIPVVSALSLRDQAGYLAGVLPQHIDTVMATDPVVELGKYWKNCHQDKKNRKKLRIGINIMSPWTTHKENPETTRSEERRVGKECRSRWSPYH